MPNECELCEKSFRSPSALRQHMRTHSVEKPFKCTVCGKGFSKSWSLTSHMQTHSSEWQYKCDICDKGFHYKANLKAHKKSHERGYNRFSCPICVTQWFLKEEYLKSHMKNIHSCTLSPGLAMNTQDIPNVGPVSCFTHTLPTQTGVVTTVSAITSSIGAAAVFTQTVTSSPSASQVYPVTTATVIQRGDPVPVTEHLPGQSDIKVDISEIFKEDIDRLAKWRTEESDFSV